MKKSILSIGVFLICFAAYAQSGRVTENVVLVTLDGLRWQELFTGADSSLITNKTFVKDPVGLNTLFWAETPQARRKQLMPFFWETIVAKGQIYGNRAYGNHVNVSNSMWFSYPGYNEILCGYPDDARIRTNNKFMNPNVTVLEFLNRIPAYKGKVAAFCSWDVFPYIINEERSGIPVNAGFRKADGPKLTLREQFLNELQDEIPSPWSSVRLDAFTHHYMLEYVKKATPKVLYISYGETDDFAHDGKYDAYLKSAQQRDVFLGFLWGQLKCLPEYKDKTTLIITTDHGRGTSPIEAWKNHGEDVPGADQIWFAVIGPDTPAMGEVKQRGQYYQKQIAKTLAAFLKVEYKSTIPVGTIIESVFRK